MRKSRNTIVLIALVIIIPIGILLFIFCPGIYFNPPAAIDGIYTGYLGKQGEPAIPILVKKLGNGSNYLAAWDHYSSASGVAYWALLKIGRPAVDPVIGVLKNDERPLARTHAAGFLGRIREQRAVEPLREACKDESYMVRESAVFSLGDYSRAEAKDDFEKIRETLLIALNDEDVNVRRAAQNALKRHDEHK